MTQQGICCSSVYRTWQLPHRVVVSGSATATSLTAHVGRMSESVMRLQKLPPEAGLRLVKALLVRVWWDGSAAAYVAGEEALGQWFGVGPSPGDALADLAEVLAEVFRDLSENEDSLSPALRRDYERLSQVIAYADQNA